MKIAVPPSFSFTSLGLAVAMAFSLAACGGADGGNADAANSTASGASTQADEEATPNTQVASPSAPAASAAAPVEEHTEAVSAATKAANAVPSGLSWRGVNLSGAEFTSTALPGTYAKQYIYPSLSEVTYFQSKGMNLIRLPFLWERMQPTLNTNLDATELKRLQDFVAGATAKGMTVLLDPHSYGHYRKQLVGSSAVPKEAFGDFWSRMATAFKGNPKVVFGLMNEPYGMTTESWVASANTAIARIRSAGAPNAIAVPGNAYSGAHSWSSSWYGTPNAVAMKQIVDPGNNMLIEVHQYLDSDSSGTSPNCVSATIGAERLANFTAWLRANGKRALLGEFAAANNSTCKQALAGMLSYMASNTDVWAGWTYWSAGPWWGDDMFSIEPAKGVDKPQMAVLQPYL